MELQNLVQLNQFSLENMEEKIMLDKLLASLDRTKLLTKKIEKMDQIY